MLQLLQLRILEPHTTCLVAEGLYGLGLCLAWNLASVGGSSIHQSRTERLSQRCYEIMLRVAVDESRPAEYSQGHKSSSVRAHLFRNALL